MPQLSRNDRATQKTTALNLTALVLTGALAGTAAATGPISIDGTSLQGGGSWNPVIPHTSWHSFNLTLPSGVQYVDSSDAVSQTLIVDVVDPTTLGLSYPKNRTPFAVFVIDGSGDELDTPMTLTWPNVHNYPADESHLVYVYDEQLGSWDVAGAATVSTDGLTLEQPDTTFNTALSYYFVDQNVLLTWP